LSLPQNGAYQVPGPLAAWTQSQPNMPTAEQIVVMVCSHHFERKYEIPASIVAKITEEGRAARLASRPAVID
jgi:hypothetical protein